MGSSGGYPYKGTKSAPPKQGGKGHASHPDPNRPPSVAKPNMVNSRKVSGGSRF